MICIDISQAVMDLNDKKLPRQERVCAIETILASYMPQRDSWPSTQEIEMLADSILREELNDRHPDKVTREEYPFFSGAQFSRRHKREASLWFAEAYSTDGQNTRSNERRMRSQYEHEWMDRGLVVRDLDRQVRYHRDTMPGQTVIYNIFHTYGRMNQEFVQCRLVRECWERCSEAT